MTKSIFTILAIILSLVASSYAQGDLARTGLKTSSFSEKFNILTEENLTIKMTHVRGYKIRKDVPWKALMTDFLRDFKKVNESIPAYEDFKIFYKQNESLVVEEIKGLQVFTIANDSSAMVKTNICRLEGRVVTIEFEVASIEGIEKTDYIAIIESAIQNYKPAPYLLRGSPIYYNAKTLKTTRRTKPMHKLSYDAGGNWGFLQSQPYLDIYGRASYSNDAQNHLYLKASFINTFEVESRQTRAILMPIIGYEYKVYSDTYLTGFGFEIGLTPTSFDPFIPDLVKFGISLNLNDRNIIDLSAFVAEEDLLLGWSIGGINLSTISRF